MHGDLYQSLVRRRGFGRFLGRDFAEAFGFNVFFRFFETP